MRKDRKNWKPTRFRGIRAAITSLQEAEVLDLSMEGALVEHEGMLHLGSRCLLQLECKGELLTIQCRVVHIRVSRSEPKGALSYQIGLKFLDLQPTAMQILGMFVRLYEAARGKEGATPGASGEGGDAHLVS